MGVLNEKDLDKLISSSPEDVCRWLCDEENCARLLTSFSETDKLLKKTVHLLGKKICEPLSRPGLLDVKDGNEEDMKKIFTLICSNKNFFLKITAKITGWRVTSWNDFLEFLTSFCALCEQILLRLPFYGKDLLTVPICTAIGVLTASTVGTHNHAHLLEGLMQLQEKIQELDKLLDNVTTVKTKNKYEFTEEDELFLHSLPPPDNYRDIEIAPTLNELMLDTHPFLRPNKIKGAYKNADHYLDVQFRLLREDFVQPLRNGIHEFLHNRDVELGKKKPRNKNKHNNNRINSRVYPSLTFQGKGTSADSISNYFFTLPPGIYKKINWNISKKLLPGSLVMLTGDLCKTAIFATIVAPPCRFTNSEGPSPRRELSKGVLRLSILSGQNLIDSKHSYMMFESEAYFEAYRYNLDILQSLSSLRDNPIMDKFIVNASDSVDIPKYFKRQHQFYRDDEDGGNDDNMVELQILVKRVQLMFQPLLEEEAELEDLHFYDYVPVPVTRNPLFWPSEELQMGLNFDENQYEAFRSALTSELSIIQGPPGTGKTFIGLQIVKTLLYNKKEHGTIPNSPILILCYTNHALDQFLELLLKEMKDLKLVRIGGQCKSESLQDHTLHKHRIIYRRELRYRRPIYYREDYDYFNGYSDSDDDDHYYYEGYADDYEEVLSEEELRLRYLCRLLKEAEETVNMLSVELNELSFPNGIFNFNNLQTWRFVSNGIPDTIKDVIKGIEWLGLEDNIFSAPDFEINDIFKELFSSAAIRENENGMEIVRQEFPYSSLATTAEREKENYSLYELEQRLSDDYFIDKHAHVREWDNVKIDSNSLYLFSCTKTNEHFTGKSSSWTRRADKNKALLLGAIFNNFNKNKLPLPGIDEILTQEGRRLCFVEETDISKLSMSKRWAIYFKLVEICRQATVRRLRCAEEDLGESQDELLEHRQRMDGEMLKGMDIIGMTTTGAAKHHAVLERAAPKIVIIEEAAEILEAHIVTSLTKDCEQLVLIGDHLQLRPSTNVYELEQKYHMNISLFERMILNQVNLCTLKKQHRMRPEIADLIVGTIYEELQNHESVLIYPSIKGVNKNLYFITHTELESTNAELLSKSNHHEAYFIVGLCKYLRQQGYRSEQITVLTAYTGQMILIKNVVENHRSCKDVRITCIDNYQGEENDIILLSLVRSNEKDNIGFVGIDNRICVTLSRARLGMYIIGNMNSLTAKSKTWEAIAQKLKAGNHCGESLDLTCPVHEVITSVKTLEDFDAVPNGGCTQICNVKLNCSHVCLRPCHPGDRSHEYNLCLQPCERSCKNQHPCVSRCGLNCPACNVMSMQFLKCGHERELACHVDMDKFKCDIPVLKTLKCEHEHEMLCSKNPDFHKCDVLVKKTLKCKHEHEMLCSLDIHLFKCGIIVQKPSKCGHLVDVQCHEDASSTKCRVKVEKVIPECKHKQIMDCFRTPRLEKCTTLVPFSFKKCRHKVKLMCWKVGDGLKCGEICDQTLECGHKCLRKCHSDDWEHKQYKCTEKCSRSCEFDHKCKSKHSCYKNCPPCGKKVVKTLICAHTAKLNCHDDGKNHKCTHVTEKLLNCGHATNAACYAEPAILNCREQIKRTCEKCDHEDYLICCFRHLMPCSNKAC